MYLLSGFGIFFSILLLLYNRGYKTANLYLGLFIFLFDFIILSHYLYLYNNSKVTIAFILSVPFNASAYAIGPLAFFYVRSIIKDNAHLSKYDWLHFIVFAIIFVGRLPYNLSNWDSKLLIADDIINNSWKSLSFTHLNNFLPLMINYKLKGFHFLFYVIAIWYLILRGKFKKSSYKFGDKHLKIVKNWLFFFAFIVSFLVILICILLFPNAKDKLIYQFEGNVIFFLIFSAFLLLFLGLILFPQILYGISLEKAALKVNKIEKLELGDLEMDCISFSEEYIEKIRFLIKNWIAENKFLDVESSIYSLSKDIDLPYHQVNYFFNQINNEKYIDWRNRLRVEYAINTMNVQIGYDKTMEVLSKESGFRSYSAFIKSFKQTTGKLPKEYFKDFK